MARNQAPDQEQERPDQPEQADKAKPADQFTVAKRILKSLKEQPLTERVSICAFLQPHIETWRRELDLANAQF